MQSLRRWPLAAAAAARSAALPAAWLLPPFPIPAAMAPEAAALLPNCAYNQTLLGLLDRSRVPASVRDVATLFAADPFLRPHHTARMLHARGIRAVANFPTPAQLGTAFSEMLGRVELGVDAEFTALRALRAEGLALHVAVTGADTARQALALQPQSIIVVRDFDTEARSMSAVRSQLARRCADVAALLPADGPHLMVLAEAAIEPVLDDVSAVIRAQRD